MVGGLGASKIGANLRFGNRSETLAHFGVVQPLSVYGRGYLLATDLCSTFACVRCSPKLAKKVSQSSPYGKCALCCLGVHCTIARASAPREEGKPVARRGRKATGLRNNDRRRPGCPTAVGLGP